MCHPAARFSQRGTGPSLEKAGAFFMAMKANIYIDGGNLYFGMLKELPNEIPIGNTGRMIRRPSAWTSPS